MSHDSQMCSFKSGVEEFARLYCAEYMKNVSVEWDLSDPDCLAATILCEDGHGMKWEVPVAPRDDGSGDIAIEIGDAGQLDADGEGLYAFLWNEACQRLHKHGITGHE